MPRRAQLQAQQVGVTRRVERYESASACLMEDRQAAVTAASPVRRWPRRLSPSCPSYRAV
jgi:hypothetical protein